MMLNKQPPTEEEMKTVRAVQGLMLSGLSLNRACSHYRVSPAWYYRRGGKSWSGMMRTRDAIEAAKRK